MVQLDTDRIGELSRYLLKSEDVDLWLNIVANPHMLSDGRTAGKAVLNQCLADLMQKGTISETVEMMAKNDCALWFGLFPFLKVFDASRTPLFIKALLTLGVKYENKDKVLK